MIIGHKPLYDADIQAKIFQCLKSVDPVSVEIERWTSSTYIEKFKNWISASGSHQIQGIDQFAHAAYCAGTYDGIQAFVHRHVTTRRIRFSRAEFVGSKIVCNNARAKWCYTEDAPLESNDAMVLSVPFSGNGNYHPQHQELLENCCDLDIPVLLDLAYFGISSGMILDFDHDCITDLVCSLSKPMSTQLRLGLRLTRYLYDDVIQVLSDNGTYNRIAVSIGNELLTQFSHDWLVNRYLLRQQMICNDLGIEPSATLTLALGDAERYQKFWREGFYRICITDELHNKF